MKTRYFTFSNNGGTFCILPGQRLTKSEHRWVADGACIELVPISRTVSRKRIEQILRAIDSNKAKLQKVRNMLIYALGLKEVDTEERPRLPTRFRAWPYKKVVK